jgi:hypothetical protein
MRNKDAYERKFKAKKCLTKAKIYDIITTKDKGKENPIKPERNYRYEESDSGSYS